MSKGKILITPRAFAKNGQEEIKRIIKNGWDVEVNDTGESYSYETFIAKAKDADGIIIGVDLADENMLKQCPDLKAIAKYGVGTDNIDLEAAKTLGIEISRTIGSNSVSVAEHTIALMFACAKNIVKSAVDVKNGRWTKPYGMELSGKTIGIIGFGNIGKKVAHIAQGIGMNINAYDSFPINPDDADNHGVHIATFDEIIESSDVITIHLPLNNETKNLIDASVLENMKNGVIIINAARGGIVNEKDLLKYLDNGKVFSAGFDVFSSEPPQNNDQLVENNNFVLTPHTASKTLAADRKTMEMSVDNILTALGEVL